MDSALAWAGGRAGGRPDWETDGQLRGRRGKGRWVRDSERY